VNLEGGRRQKSRQLELPWEGRGEAPSVPRSDESPAAVQGTERPGADDLMQKALTRQNMKAALRRVKKNRGGPGVDGMTVDELLPYLWERWEEIKSSLLDGSYRPSPVKRQEIPKSGGGIRELGIPTVLDRLIQQALLQVLQPQFDRTFSEHSHGFRPGRSAHGAIREAQRYVQEGRRIVVDVDLERFSIA
jgi:RNA-directed DNA polymerase